jgi:hypothetical protein
MACAIPTHVTNTLVIISDVHVGANEHAEREFDEALRWVKDEGVLLLANGDLADNAIVSGKAPGEKLLGQAMWPTEQAKILASKLKPFAKKGKLVGIVRGNHEARSRREALFDLCEFIAYAIEAPYLGVGGYLRFNSGSQAYTVAVQHGRSGAANGFFELDKMHRLYPRAELLALGHNHHLASRRIYGLDVGKNGTETLREVWQVRTGSFLRYSDYVREAVLTPQRMGCPIIRFDPKEHRISVDLDTLSWGL